MVHRRNSQGIMRTDQLPHEATFATKDHRGIVHYQSQDEQVGIRIRKRDLQIETGKRKIQIQH